MKTRIIGDVHGYKESLKKIIYDRHQDVTSAIQLGDMGVGFNQGLDWHNDLQKSLNETNTFFIRGNHDNPSVCNDFDHWITDGHYDHNTESMYIGGAWSIDNPNAPPGWYRRTPFVDWWPDEECTDKQFESFFNEYSNNRPQFMFTHDCPKDISYAMFWETGFLRGPVHQTRTGNWLQVLLEAHQPSFHFFGHWHKTMAFKYGRTTFMCLGELDYIDIDMNDPEQVHDAIYRKTQL